MERRISGDIVIWCVSPWETTWASTEEHGSNERVQWISWRWIPHLHEIQNLTLWIQLSMTLILYCIEPDVIWGKFNSTFANARIWRGAIGTETHQGVHDIAPPNANFTVWKNLSRRTSESPDVRFLISQANSSGTTIWIRRELKWKIRWEFVNLDLLIQTDLFQSPRGSSITWPRLLSSEI